MFGDEALNKMWRLQVCADFGVKRCESQPLRKENLVDLGFEHMGLEAQTLERLPGAVQA